MNRLTPPPVLEAEPLGAAGRVAFGIMQALEQQRLVPGQRLVETDLAVQFGVGRNAVREAIQQLAARGIVDLSRNRSPAIRHLSLPETLDVLEVAEAMTGVLARVAARNFDRATHLNMLRAAMDELTACEKSRDPDAFSRARRRFYRTLLNIGGNRELDHLFAAMHMQIVHAQYRSPGLQDLRFVDYREIAQAVTAGDVKAAERAGKQHVKRVRQVVEDIAANA